MQFFDISFSDQIESTGDKFALNGVYTVRFVEFKSTKSVRQIVACRFSFKRFISRLDGIYNNAEAG